MATGENSNAVYSIVVGLRGDRVGDAFMVTVPMSGEDEDERKPKKVCVFDFGCARVWLIGDSSGNVCVCAWVVPS